MASLLSMLSTRTFQLDKVSGLRNADLTGTLAASFERTAVRFHSCRAIIFEMSGDLRPHTKAFHFAGIRLYGGPLNKPRTCHVRRSKVRKIFFEIRI